MRSKISDWNIENCLVITTFLTTQLRRTYSSVTIRHGWSYYERHREAHEAEAVSLIPEDHTLLRMWTPYTSVPLLWEPISLLAYLMVSVTDSIGSIPALAVSLPFAAGAILAVYVSIMASLPSTCIGWNEEAEQSL